MCTGLQVKRIAVLSDEHDDIVAEVRDQVHKYVARNCNSTAAPRELPSCYEKSKDDREKGCCNGV